MSLLVNVKGSRWLTVDAIDGQCFRTKSRCFCNRCFMGKGDVLEIVQKGRPGNCE